MIATHRQLLNYIYDGYIDALTENVNAASIDVRLNDEFVFESPYGFQSVKKEKYMLEPREFLLASTIEKFNMPDFLSAEFKLKSSLAREGLNHNLACWIDPGFNNSVLTLELFNCLTYSSIELRAGQKIGQIIFHIHEPVSKSYSYASKGQYNNDLSTQISKGVR